MDGLISHSDLFREIISLENLFAAWREFKRGKTKKKDVQEFEFSLEDNVFVLHEDLRCQLYLHATYQSFYISDPKRRHINKATVRDRLVHQAVFRVLYPIFDKHFIHDSYSCRIEKGTHRAVKRLDQFVRKVSNNYRNTAYVLKLDVNKFFDSVDHTTLKQLIWRHIEDDHTRWLVDVILNSFSTKLEKGLPLGNVTSQLFANIYLNELDQFMKHEIRCRYYIRYCDDFVIVHEDKGYLKSFVAPVHHFLETRLNLSLHENKIILRKLRHGVDFLGYVTLPHYRVLRTKTSKRIFKRAMAGLSEQSLCSYLGIFKHCKGYTLSKKLKNYTR